MGLRELKEAAHAQYVRGKFGQCAQTYQQILKLAPKDPNMRVRHAEACRRAGDRVQAITSYRMAADLLLAVGCESRARGAIKAALELDPKDPVLLAELARLGPSGTSAFTGLEEERVPGAMEAWETPSTPARSMTSAGVPAPRSLTSAGVPAPRSMTSASVPAPRSMTSAGLPATPPARSLTSTLRAALTPSAPPRPSVLALPPAPAPTNGRPSTSVAGGSAQGSGASAHRTPPPVPSAARTPAGGSPGAFASAQGPGGAPRSSTAVMNAPSAASMTPPPAPAAEKNVRLQVEVRRLSPQAVAFRLSPQSRWVLFTSRAPISVSREDTLPTEVRDFTLDITVEEPLGDGSLH